MTEKLTPEQWVEIMRWQQTAWEARRGAFGVELIQPATPTPKNGVVGQGDGKKAA